MKRSVRGNTYVLLLALMVLLVVLSSACVGVFALRVSSSELESITRQNTLLRQSDQRAHIDSLVQGYQNTFLSVAISPSILDQLTRASNDTTEDILRFRQILLSLQSLAMNAGEVGKLAVYFERTGTVAAQDGKFSQAEFGARYGEQTWARVKSAFADARAFTLTADVAGAAGQSERVLIFGKGLPYYSAYPFGGVLIEVPARTLEGALSPEEGTLQLVLSQTGETLLSRHAGMPQSVAEAALETLPSMLSDDADHWFDVSLCGETYYVAVTVSQSTRWRFLHVKKVESVLGNLRPITFGTVGICLLTALVSILIAWMCLRRLYTPISDLLTALEKHGAPYRPGRSAGRELSHISGVVNMAWQQNDAMRALLSGANDTLRLDALSDLMDGQHVEQSVLRQTGLAGQTRDVAVALCYLPSLPEGKTAYAVLSGAADALPSPWRGRVTCLPRPRMQAAFLLPCDDEALLSALHDSVRAQAGQAFALAVSGVRSGLEGLEACAQEAQEARYRACVAGVTGVVRYGSMPDLPDFSAPQMKEALQNLYAQAVEQGDPTVRHLVSLLQKNAREDDGQKPVGADDMGAVLHSVLRARGGSDRLQGLMRAAEKPREKKISKEQLKAYITQQAENPNLSLSMMARDMHYSGAYLSGLVKDATGTGFVEYLTLLRISRAKQLLSASDALVSDISAQVGFGHVNTMIRAFRRYERMTPAQYRQSVTRDTPASS